MAIHKRFIHFKEFKDFNSKKLSANETNTQYTLGVSGEIQEGDPDVLYQSYVWIKDTQQQWTHGQLYNGRHFVVDEILSDDSINPVANKAIKEYVDLHSQYEPVDEINVPVLELPMVKTDDALSATSIYPVQNRIVTHALNSKVDKVSGKQLSTEDFTTILKNKLLGLTNYDDTAINNAVKSLETRLNTLVNGDVTTAIDSYNDIIAFLENISDYETLDGIIAGIERQIATIQQSIPDTSNLATKAELNSKQNILVSGTNIKTINGESILGNGDIQVVAEITVDSSVSDTSTNPIQNKAIKDYVDSNTYEQRIIYRVANGALTTSQRTHNAETYTKLINREKIAVYYSDFNNTPLIPLSVGSMNMMTNVITLVHYSGVAPNIATTTFELHSDGNVESASILYNAPNIDAALSSTSTNSIQNKVITAALDNKIDKVTGKGLSTEDFTTALKTKLEGLTNYDDAAIQNAVSGLTTQLNTLVNGDASTAIESFNEITAFLANVTDEESLEGIVAGIEQQISTKQDKINDLDTIRSGAAKGATAIQQVKTINGEEIVGEGNIEINVDTSTLATKEELEDNEEVTAAALSELNQRIEAFKESVSRGNATKEELQDAVNELTGIIEDNEEVTAAALSALDRGKADAYKLDTKSDKVKVFGLSSVTSIEPNKYYMATSPMSSLTITLVEPIDDKVLNNYMFEFITSSSGCSLSVPATIKWVNGEAPTLVPDVTYQVSIINNLAVISKFL